jgi:hypothetical protein
VRDLKRVVQASAPATLLGALEDLLAEVEQVEMESWAAGGLVDRVAAKVTSVFSSELAVQLSLRDAPEALENEAAAQQLVYTT